MFISGLVCLNLAIVFHLVVMFVYGLYESTSIYLVLVQIAFTTYSGLLVAKWRRGESVTASSSHNAMGFGIVGMILMVVFNVEASKTRNPTHNVGLIVMPILETLLYTTGFVLFIVVRHAGAEVE